MSGTIEVPVDLCHKGNHENIIGQPDMVHMRPPGTDGPIPDLVWFTCASEANGINMFPCTGSRHIDHKTVVVCTCACHKPATLAGQPNPFAEPNATGPDPFLGSDAHTEQKETSRG